jgi:hypothetical protein
MAVQQGYITVEVLLLLTAALRIILSPMSPVVVQREKDKRLYD